MEDIKRNDYNRTLGLEGNGYSFQITDNGVNKAYTLMPLSLKMKAKFSEWVVKRNLQSAMDAEQAYNQRIRQLTNDLRNGQTNSLDEQLALQECIEQLKDSAKSQMAEFNAKKSAGEFYFHSKATQQSMSTTEGSIYLLSLMLEPKHPTITLDQCEELFINHQTEIIAACREAQNLGKSQAPMEVVNP